MGGGLFTKTLTLVTRFFFFVLFFLQMGRKRFCRTRGCRNLVTKVATTNQTVVAALRKCYYLTSGLLGCFQGFLITLRTRIYTFSPQHTLIYWRVASWKSKCDLHQQLMHMEAHTGTWCTLKVGNQVTARLSKTRRRTRTVTATHIFLK